MPGIPVAARQNLYHPDVFEHVSTEEELVAEESLSIYCRPVELYNIIQRRAISNPSFLQRCLHYKIKAKHKRRIQMTVSLSRTVTESQTVIPLYICMARLVSDVRVPENSAVYRVSRIFMFRNPPGTDSNIQVQAKFTLPEVNKLAVEARSDSIAILFVSTVENSNSSLGVNASLLPTDLASSDSTSGEYYSCGKVSLESLYMAWDSSPNFHLGQRAEIRSTVDLLPCILKSDFQNEETSIFVHVPCNSEIVSTPKRIQITISAEEFRAQEKSPFHTYAGSEVPSTSLSHIIRLREGNVMFNYRYYKNKLQRTEVTEDFCCPFCLVSCASFKGLRYHLPSSHDLFNFEFWVSEECQAVNVSVKTNIWRSEIVGEGIDPKLQTFFFCAKPRKRRRPKNLTLKNAKDVLETNFPARDTELLEKDDGLSAIIIPLHPDPDCVLSVSEYDIVTPAVLHFAKTRKLSIEHSDPRNCAPLRKREFFHSHRAQPMAIEQVLSDQDSENEIDEDVADLEDKKMLDNFVDVSKDEKQIMHMWNSFVRKQHVLADGHIPWACEAFSNLHATELDGSTSLAWCWRLFMIKLWNHGLLDAKTMNDCNVVLEQYKKLNTNPKS